MRVLFLPTITLICCNKRKHNVIFELHSEKKKLWKSEKDWQTDSYEQAFIDDETSWKGAGEYRERSGLATKMNPNFLQDLTRFFQKGRVIAKSRLTSNETCYLYGRLTST